MEYAVWDVTVICGVYTRSIAVEEKDMKAQEQNYGIGLTECQTRLVLE